jgi:hypothetical protein
VTALYGAIGMPLFILAKGGVRYYASGTVNVPQKQDAVCRWAASSALAGILAHKYIGGPDMRMGEVVEQRQMLQQLQKDILNGLSPLVAALLAALDLARQKVMDPDGYSQESLRHDLAVLRRPDAPLVELEDSPYRLQRVHPGPHRADFVRALVSLIQEQQGSPMVRRNAALAVAKLGSADPSHRAMLLAARTDPDLSSRAACHWALHQMAIPTPKPCRAANALRPFWVSRNAVPRGRWEIEHVLRKHVDEVVDNVPHGHNTRWPALVINKGNVVVFANTHLVEGIGEFVIHTQAVRIGCHERANPQAVYVNPTCHHFGEDVPHGEHPHQVA